MTYIQQGFRDTLVYPDKYNTGVNPIADDAVRGTLIEVTTAGTYGGIVFSLYNVDPYLAIRWNNATNNALGSYVLIENYDFSHFEYLASALESSANIVRLVEFKNCILPEFRSGTADYNISYKFTNCKIQQITGSHFHTLRCDIGHTPNDGIDPLKTVIIEDTYISDICHYTEAYTHTDGIQISGTAGIDADNINIINTRIEAPLLKISGSNFGMAGCLFFDVESANSNNVHVENCTVNGAGYSVTIVTENGFDISNYTLENVDIGYSHQFGALGTIDSRATLTNVGYATRMYIGSVWKDESNNTHLSVTNDTNTEKILILYTNNGFQQVVIPKCPRYSEVIQDVTTFENLPFDIDLNIGVIDYVVAFDGNVTVDNQIRFVNYTESEIEFPQNFYNIPCSINVLLQRRRMLQKYIQQQNPNYTPLTWLQSDGNCIIDTGIIANNDLTIETNINLSGALTGAIFGASGNASSATQSRFALTKTTSPYGSSNTAISPTLSNSVDYHILKDGNVTIANGTTIGTATVATFTSVNPIGIFGAFGGTTYKASKTYNQWKMYGTDGLFFQIRRKSTGEILFDGIIVLDGSNVPCIYDKITKTFRYNEGTGTFTYA